MSDRKYVTIRVEGGEGRTTITLDRAERRNAIGPLMVNELLDAFGDAFEDDETRTIVLAGAGKAFCAGGDFAQMKGGDGESALPSKGDYADLLSIMIRAPKPIVARVHGHAMGGGLGLVAASTFAIAAEDAKLGTPEIKVGLFPMMIMAVLARLVHRRKLLEMMLFGERLSAREACEAGIVNRVTEASSLDDAVDGLCSEIAKKSPITVKLGLEAYADQADLSLDQALPMLRERLGACLATQDAVEGLTAFMQKRTPQWKGR